MLAEKVWRCKLGRWVVTLKYNLVIFVVPGFEQTLVGNVTDEVVEMVRDLGQFEKRGCFEVREYGSKNLQSY